jgi:hypothetical protein
VKLTDSCGCGAEFNAEDSFAFYVQNQHGDWLKAHAVCRQREPRSASAFGFGGGPRCESTDVTPDTEPVTAKPARWAAAGVARGGDGCGGRTDD